jgi:hypothetical protein
MITVDLLQFVAVAFAVCGLAVVIWEIASKDSGIFREMTDDARGFAERPATRPEAPDSEAGDRETQDSKARPVSVDGKIAAAAAGGKPQTPQRAA